MTKSFLEKLKSLENDNESESETEQEEFGTNSDLIITTPKRKRVMSESEFSEPPRQPILNNSPRIRLNTPIRRPVPDSPIKRVSSPQRNIVEEKVFNSPQRDNLSDPSSKLPEVPEPIENRKITPLKTSTPQRISPFKKPETPISVIDDEDVNDRVYKLVNNSSDIDYSNETNEVKLLALDLLRAKFDNLRMIYKDRNIVYPENKKLNTVHKKYHEEIKAIYVSMNLSQIQIGYVVFVMAIEFCCVKFLKLPMSGYTKMELKRIYKHQQLMIEIGHSMYKLGGGEGGGSQWSLEWRVGSTMLWNIAMFLCVKFLSNYIGGESMIEVIRNIIDGVLENPVSKNDVENGTFQNNNNTEADLLSLFGGGKEGNGLADLIANVGTKMTENIEKKPTEKKSKIIFDD